MKIIIYALIYNLVGLFLLILGIKRIRKINKHGVIKINRKCTENMSFNISKKGIYSIWICTYSKFRCVNIFGFSLFNNCNKVNIYPSIYPYQRNKLNSRIEIGTFRGNKGVYQINFKTYKKNSDLIYFYIGTGKSYFYKIISLIILFFGFFISFSGIIYLFSLLSF